MLPALQSAIGLLALVAVTFLFSARRDAISRSLVAKALGLQLLLALLLLKLPGSQQVFLALNDGLVALQTATVAGTSFIFGYVGGGPAPFEVVDGSAVFIFAFQALPLVMVVSVLSALLMYWKILPLIMRGFSLVLERALSISGACGLAISANAFLGMVEAPLLIRSYLASLNRGELFTVMCAGMATIAGTMLALEAAIISPVVPGALGHLISCSIITLPAVVYIAHLLEPDSVTDLKVEPSLEGNPESAMDALMSGTQDGLMLYLNIIAMIIVVVALTALVNLTLGIFPDVLGAPVTLERILGVIMTPLALATGVPWGEARVVGDLLGTRLVLTELVAYIRLGDLPPEVLTERSRILATYALCGFANLGGLGIMLAGLTTMVPERRAEILELGFKAVAAGTLATCSTAAVVGILL